MSQNDEALTGEVRNEPAGEAVVSPDGWQRIVRCPITGRRHVAARPGARKVTSEEIYRLWREDFP